MNGRRKRFPGPAIAFGFTIVMADGSKPSDRRLRTMIRPGFIFSETPTTATVRGTSIFPSL